MSVRKLLSALEWTQEQRATLRHHLAPVYKYFLCLRSTKHKDKNKYKFKRNKKKNTSVKDEAHMKRTNKPKIWS